MAWLFVPGLGCSTSASSSPIPTTDLWCTSSGKPKKRPPSWRGWSRKAHYLKLLSGTTWEPSTVERGVAAWILSLRASRASPSALRDSDGARPTSGGSGPILPAAFAMLGPNGSFSKMCPDFFMGEWPPYSETWPKSGSMRNGVVSARPQSEPAIGARGFSSWPTPAAVDATRTGEHLRQMTLDALAQGASKGVSLHHHVAHFWPTPNVPNGGRTMRPEDVAAKGATEKGKRQVGLENVSRLWPSLETMAMWPTPHASAATGKGTQGRAGGENIQTTASRFSRPAPKTPTDGRGSSTLTPRLNPRFVEHLMGQCPGWTDSECSAIPWSRWLRLSRIALSEIA